MVQTHLYVTKLTQMPNCENPNHLCLSDIFHFKNPPTHTHRHTIFAHKVFVDIETWFIWPRGIQFSAYYFPEWFRISVQSFAQCFASWSSSLVYSTIANERQCWCWCYWLACCSQILPHFQFEWMWKVLRVLRMSLVFTRNLVFSSQREKKREKKRERKRRSEKAHWNKSIGYVKIHWNIARFSNAFLCERRANEFQIYVDCDALICQRAYRRMTGKMAICYFVVANKFSSHDKHSSLNVKACDSIWDAFVHNCEPLVEIPSPTNFDYTSRFHIGQSGKYKLSLFLSAACIHFASVYTLFNAVFFCRINSNILLLLLLFL